MVALWRLVTASDLHCVIDEPGQHLRLLPASIKSQLTHYAQREMFTTEEKVFNETRSLLSPTFRSQESPAIWAALWSIILLYRQALLMNQQKVMYFNDKFDEVTSKLFDGLVIILSCRFRTRKSLESLDLPIQPAFLGDPTIKMAYDRAQDERSGFCESFFFTAAAIPFPPVAVILTKRQTKRSGVRAWRWTNSLTNMSWNRSAGSESAQSRERNRASLWSVFIELVSLIMAHFPFAVVPYGQFLFFLGTGSPRALASQEDIWQQDSRDLHNVIPLCIYMYA